ncbi:MAG: porin, partial [Halocynthiibacter sp.]
MKKFLFVTTALVATAGVAAAEVRLSGSAELGVYGGTGIETQFWSDLDVRFTLSGETDNGLTFGATIDLDEVGGGIPATTTQSQAVFLSGDFGTLTMGDTDGA